MATLVTLRHLAVLLRVHTIITSSARQQHFQDSSCDRKACAACKVTSVSSLMGVKTRGCQKVNMTLHTHVSSTHAPSPPHTSKITLNNYCYWLLIIEKMPCWCLPFLSSTSFHVFLTIIPITSRPCSNTIHGRHILLAFISQTKVLITFPFTLFLHLISINSFSKTIWLTSISAALFCTL